MIGVGGVIALMGFLGCCGACCENKCLLKIFFNIIFIVFFVEVIAAVLLLLDRPGAEKILEKISNKVAKSIKDTYGQNEIITRAWNETMTLMKCCGYNNYTDFQGTKFESQTSLYPNFCCLNEQSLLCDLKKAETASVNGCFKAVVNWVTSKATLLGGVAICVAAIQCPFPDLEPASIEEELEKGEDGDIQAGYLMIAIGGALTFVGFLGCYGAYYENKNLLNIVERFWEIYSIKVAEKIKKTYNQDNFVTKLWNETMTLGVTGCFKAVVKWVSSKATLLGGMAISVAVIQVAVMIASRKLSNS
ncbi:hypothetical protein C0J50_14508 [Silurus asotus]|uniref:Tetraspanin n=1 Tax=Silurus asotus TaxID=30991 RepID=A0AAD5AZP3_SILAS|nr:hypothetical protein C0J50_14508 [Silurus asotus]